MSGVEPTQIDANGIQVITADGNGSVSIGPTGVVLKEGLITPPLITGEIGYAGFSTTNPNGIQFISSINLNNHDIFDVNEISATTFTGALSGNAATATYATSAGSATSATTATTATNATYATSAGTATSATTATTATTATSATSATTATNANNVAITSSSTNATFYPTFVSNTSGNNAMAVDSNLTYNPSTDIMSFGSPPICTTSASSANQFVNWNNFTNIQSYSPILRDDAGNNLNSGNYTQRIGRYIQIGNLVWVQVRIQISAKTGLGVAGNTIQVTLPVNASSFANSTQALSVGSCIGMNNSIVSCCSNIPAGGADYTNFNIRTAASTGTADISVGDISTTFQIRFGGFYFSS